MGSPIPFRKFRKLFERHGVEVSDPDRSSHVKMRKFIDGQMRVYIAVVHHNEVQDVYVKAARKAFGLSLQDGLPDKQFFK